MELTGSKSLRPVFPGYLFPSSDSDNMNNIGYIAPQKSALKKFFTVMYQSYKDYVKLTSDNTFNSAEDCFKPG